MKITFVLEHITHNYVKCYSSNFHFYDKNEPETIKMDPSIDSAVKQLYEFSAEIAEEESFYPWITTQVYFFIHSPFTSVNPFQKGIALKSGYQYNIDIKLEEEHLLPYPYHTDCTNYEALWIKNNKTGPRSQQMCREVCELSSVRQCFGCDKELIMVEEPKNLCFGNRGCNEKNQILDNRTLCQRNCKADCL
ncbi:uncharacterized protein TNCT_67421 [Trichonephila clavata]|uniref:Uncharacterized protein n=1 Tax=Trichonephila clavata TaxID=2740835 RepID=A0A8X6H6K8_TRICU|nr:uncharacterized protein TNCT_67421 [Trichonephila clavata]